MAGCFGVLMQEWPIELQEEQCSIKKPIDFLHLLFDLKILDNILQDMTYSIQRVNVYS